MEPRPTLNSAIVRFARQRKLILTAVVLTAAIVLVTFYPALKIGLFSDDPWFIEKAGRLSLPEYLAFYFAPNMQVFWYRPFYGLLILVEYVFFRSEPTGYHATQILLHLTNCLLLFAIAYRLSRRVQLGVLSALFYAVLAPGSSAVYWISVQDPLAVFFCLATISFWILYLQNQGRLWYSLALVALIGSFLSKESSVFLPLVLFLLDRWIIREQTTKTNLVARYSPVGLVLVAYLTLEFQVQSNGYFPQHQGYGFGIHILDNGLRYLRLALWPFGLDDWAADVGLVAIFSLLLIAFRGRLARLPFRPLLLLVTSGLAAIAPVLGFPSNMFEPRYLYVLSISSALLFAIVCGGAWMRASSWWYRGALALVITWLVLLHSGQTSDTAQAMVESARQARISVRDIYQQHPTFPPDTYLYLADGCVVRHYTGWFFVRYGTNVTVMCPDVELGGVDTSAARENRFAGLREHQNSFVYYYDEAKRRHEVQVDPSAAPQSSQSFPVTYQHSIQLQGFEVTSTTIERDQAMVLFLYWQALDPIDRDYTVFVHLVDENGQFITGLDNQPRNGAAPMTHWQKNKLVVDPHILPIPSDAPLGTNYHLEIGLYDLATMERVQIIDSTQHIISDTLIIQSLGVVERTAE